MEKMVRRVCLIAALLFSTQSVIAQVSTELSVRNVRFTDLGDTVRVQYDLQANPEKKYTISLLLSYDGGETFPIIPRILSGDAGGNIRAGQKKTIFWHISKDFPEGLIGDEFVFAVEAKLEKPKSKLPYILFTAGVTGGTVALLRYFTRKGPDPTTGTIVIKIPDSLLGDD
jgi:hypothetical protein